MTKTKSLRGKGHFDCADDGQNPSADAPHPLRSKGRANPANDGPLTRADAPSQLRDQGHARAAGEGQHPIAEVPYPIATLVAQIRRWHADRRYYEAQRICVMNRLGARIRTLLGWSLQLPEKDRAKIAKETLRIIKSNGENTDFAHMIEATKIANAHLEASEDVCIKQIAELAEQLPVWQWAKDIRGFGLGALGIIVGEAGDLSNYASKSKLWKRMGVAVMGEVRQGGLPKGAAAEDWIAHGYNRQRRSMLFRVGDALIKNNQGVYRAAYDRRKAYEIARDPDMKPMQAHRRAQRYMEKMLLRDLRAAWLASSAMADRPVLKLRAEIAEAA